MRASRTRLYREYKLCRLLLRPAVNDRRAVTGRSASLRQTTTSRMCWYSSSNLADHDDDDDDDDGGDASGSRHDVAVTCVVFADDATNDVQTDERVTSLESKHQMSLQSMKELLLNSVNVFSADHCMPLLFRIFLYTSVNYTRACTCM